MKKRISPRDFLVCISIFNLILVLPACNKDWLDIKADKRQVVPESNKDFQAILDNTTHINTGIAECLLIQEVSADGHVFSDQYFAGIPPEYGYLSNAYVWTTVYPFELLSNYQFNYSRPYTSILRCNTILDAKQGEKEPDEWAHIKAQAAYLRANFHFYLVQTFAAPFDPATAEHTPGIPLKLNADITAILKRSTVLQVYQQIIKDLQDAIPSLPKIPKYITRVSKPAALGLLARVYLNMGKYEEALHYANEYLTLRSELLEFNTLNPADLYIGLNKEVTFMEYINAGFGGMDVLGQTSYSVDQALFAQYHPDDLRRTVFFNETQDGIRFKGNYLNAVDERFVGIATDEIYLIRAECYARLGQLSLAMKDLNDLLRTRWAKNSDGSSKYADQTAASETDALRKIFLERRKELILRGLRWTDLRRLNQDPRFTITLKRTIQGKEYTLLPNSPRYTYPFPKEAIQQGDIEQNPGW